MPSVIMSLMNLRFAKPAQSAGTNCQPQAWDTLVNSRKMQTSSQNSVTWHTHIVGTGPAGEHAKSVDIGTQPLKWCVEAAKNSIKVLIHGISWAPKTKACSMLVGWCKWERIFYTIPELNQQPIRPPMLTKKVITTTPFSFTINIPLIINDQQKNDQQQQLLSSSMS